MTKAEKKEKLEQHISLRSDMRICERIQFSKKHGSENADNIIQRIAKMWELEEMQLKIDFRNYKMFSEIDKEFK